MATNLTEFYRSVRDDEALMARLGEIGSVDTLIDETMAEARARGVTLTAEDVRAALADPEGFLAVAVGDELTDSELELVSAGMAKKVGDGGSGN